MKRLFREPLLHFALIGALFFCVYAWLNQTGPGGAGERQVRIAESDVKWLKETWARQWQRPPDERELQGLVTDYLREALLAREASAMGLEENDTIIRRRLAQKLEFLVQDTAQLGEPDEAQLRAHFERHRTQYLSAARASFAQLYFKTGDGARAALAQIAAGGAEGLGERSLLQPEVSDAEEGAVAKEFGPGFAAAVFKLEPGLWQGPVESSFGFHLVRVSGRETARPLSFEEARKQVVEAWRHARQLEAKEEFFAALLKKYDVVVDEAARPFIKPLAN